ncbi:MAG: ABC transporter ATP-binding protein [Bacilli bacterium]
MTRKIYVVTLSILNVITSFFLIVQVYLFRNIIDNAVNHISIVKDIIYIAVLLGIMIALRLVYFFIKNKFSLSLEVHLKGQVYKSIMNKKYEKIASIHSGKISNIYLTDIRNVQEAEVNAIPNMFLYTSRILFAFVALINLNYVIVLILSSVGLLLFVLALIYGYFVKKLNREALKSDDSLNAYMQESLDNVKLLKVLSVHDVIDKNVDEELKKNYIVKNRRNRVSIIASSFLSSMITILYALTLCYAAYLIFEGKISYGTLTALVSLVSYFESPFSYLAKTLNQLYQARVSKDRIASLMALEDEEELLPIEDFDSIVFDKMTFKYDDRIIYKDFSYCINKGDNIVVKGDSGSGKTTFINILLGFYSYEGKVYVKNKDQQYDISEKTRSLFSYVPQENVLFSGTIRSNFKMFYPAITDEEIISVLKDVQVYDELKEQGGLDYQIYQRGKGLSIGQIQRILIALALASCKPILVMDEFTSALDLHNEEVIASLVCSLSKTLIMVSHRNIKIEGARILDVSSLLEKGEDKHD